MLINSARASALMNAEGVDGIVSATLENNFYLAGAYLEMQEMFPRDAESYVVATAAKPEAGTVVCSIGGADLVDAGYPTVTEAVTFGTFFRDIVDGVPLDPDEERVKAITQAHQTGRSSLSALVQAITQLGLAESVVAVDERGPNRNLLEKLQEQLPKAKIIAGSGLFRRIRAVKTDEEVQRVIAALRATEAGLRAAYAAFAVGVTERELKLAFEVEAAQHGARTGFFLCRFGKGLALGQVPPGETKLAAGDFAFFDVGVNLEGYKSDIGRLISFGEPSQTIQALFDASKAGQQTAIDMMRPGVVARDIFHAAVERVRQSGIPTYQRQHVGHGIGVEYYDLPVLEPGETTELEANMTFEVETPYYRLGVGGAFIEDTVLVTDSGPQILTTLSRDLQIIEPR
ncbi:MAG: Xaa-Pro peptidase family protein [Micrococcales bacterium]|nr:Xaa-Pro peptidase family protein [Micrococcales bacterium]